MSPALERSTSPDAYDSPLSNHANYDGSESSLMEGEDGDENPITITTTIGSGSNKRKEVMTLPLPPGALPPRKRAKTKDEKEQRRIERIMRNRQAAHASREKKRRHVEDLEKKCVSLSTENEQLQGQVQQLTTNFNEASDHSTFLRKKINELVSIIEAAKKSGDTSSLETACFLQDVDLKLTTTITPVVSTAMPTEIISKPSESATFPAPSLVIDHSDSDTSSENGSMAIPSLSSSAATSPSTSPLDIMIKSEESDNVVISLPGEEYPLFGLVDYRSHHPAEVMCKSKHDQQRRPPNQPKTVPTLSSSTT